MAGRRKHPPQRQLRLFRGFGRNATRTQTKSWAIHGNNLDIEDAHIEKYTWGQKRRNVEHKSKNSAGYICSFKPRSTYSRLYLIFANNLGNKR